jgi:hypothetical protein
MGQTRAGKRPDQTRLVLGRIEPRNMADKPPVGRKTQIFALLRRSQRVLVHLHAIVDHNETPRIQADAFDEEAF